MKLWIVGKTMNELENAKEKAKSCMQYTLGWCCPEEQEKVLVDPNLLEGMLIQMYLVGQNDALQFQLELERKRK